MQKISGFILFLIILSSGVCTSFADNAPEYQSKYGETGGQAVLIADEYIANISGLPRNYRTCISALSLEDKEKAPSLLGLRELAISGSAEFTAAQLSLLYASLQGFMAVNQPLIIVDLRQESHGFINGIPISWYGVYDWANAGLTYQQVVDHEQNQLMKLSLKNRVKLALPQDKSFAILQPFIILSEQQLVTEQGIGYKRITATDRIKPNDEAVEMFVEFVINLPEKSWLHFHCHAGDGRTTTFMAMYDIMNNYAKVSLDDIVKRQQAIGGRNLFYTGGGGNPLAVGWEQERAEFLRQFYNYVTANAANNYVIKWSEWCTYGSQQIIANDR